MSPHFVTHPHQQQTETTMWLLRTILNKDRHTEQVTMSVHNLLLRDSPPSIFTVNQQYFLRGDGDKWSVRQMSSLALDFTSKEVRTTSHRETSSTHTTSLASQTLSILQHWLFFFFFAYCILKVIVVQLPKAGYDSSYNCKSKSALFSTRFFHWWIFQVKLGYSWRGSLSCLCGWYGMQDWSTA